MGSRPDIEKIDVVNIDGADILFAARDAGGKLLGYVLAAFRNAADREAVPGLAAAHAGFDAFENVLRPATWFTVDGRKITGDGSYPRLGWFAGGRDTPPPGARRQLVAASRAILEPVPATPPDPDETTATSTVEVHVGRVVVTVLPAGLSIGFAVLDADGRDVVHESVVLPRHVARRLTSDITAKIAAKIASPTTGDPDAGPS